MLKRFARFILEPVAKVFRKFFDPRFSTLESTLEAIVLRDGAVRDALTLTNTRITHIEGDLTSQHAYLQDAQAKLDYLIADISERRPSTTGQISGGDADLLNYSESHRGFRSQTGLWFNPPDVVRYTPGAVELSVMTERSIEVPFVISSVTSLAETGASVLDVGCAESLVSFEFASLGYKVTGIDLREYPLNHPNLTTVATPLEDWDTDETFDVVVCLSSIEHFGLGTYGEEVAEERLDHVAMRMLLERIRPDGSLVMTIPYGETEVTPVQRMYNHQDLDALLDGWVIDTLRIAVPAAQGWAIADEYPEPAPTADPPVTRQVALITAHPDA